MLTDCCETFASRLIAIDCSQSKLLKDDLQSNIDTVNAICVKETLFFAYNRISRGGVYSLTHTYNWHTPPLTHWYTTTTTLNWNLKTALSAIFFLNFSFYITHMENISGQNSISLSGAHVFQSSFRTLQELKHQRVNLGVPIFSTKNDHTSRKAFVHILQRIIKRFVVYKYDGSANNFYYRSIL